MLPPGAWTTAFPGSAEPIFGGVQLSLRQIRGLQIAAGLLAGIAVRIGLRLHGVAPAYSIPGANVHDRDDDHSSDKYGLGQAERLLHDVRLLAKRAISSRTDEHIVTVALDDIKHIQMYMTKITRNQSFTSLWTEFCNWTTNTENRYFFIVNNALCLNMRIR